MMHILEVVATVVVLAQCIAAIGFGILWWMTSDKDSMR